MTQSLEHILSKEGKKALEQPLKTFRWDRKKFVALIYGGKNVVYPETQKHGLPITDSDALAQAIKLFDLCQNRVRIEHLSEGSLPKGFSWNALYGLMLSEIASAYHELSSMGFQEIADIVTDADRARQLLPESYFSQPERAKMNPEYVLSERQKALLESSLNLWWWDRNRFVGSFYSVMEQDPDAFVQLVRLFDLCQSRRRNELDHKGYVSGGWSQDVLYRINLSEIASTYTMLVEMGYQEVASIITQADKHRQLVPKKAEGYAKLISV